MVLISNLLFLLVFGYYSFIFIQVLVKMRQTIILPANEKEEIHLRKHPQLPLDTPSYSKQKTGIIMHVTVLVIVAGFYVSGHIFDFVSWPQYMLLLVICLLPSSYNLLNLFAMTTDGILSGSRFIAWHKIKSFQFVPIYVNHRYYGHAKEVNDAYELKIKLALFSTSCVVMSDSMKEKVYRVLNRHVGSGTEYEMKNESESK